MEQKVGRATVEIDAYKKRCELLQKQNASLMTQLNNLRALLVNQSSPGNIIKNISNSRTISSTNLSLSEDIKPDPIITNIKIEPDCK